MRKHQIQNSGYHWKLGGGYDVGGKLMELQPYLLTLDSLNWGFDM